MSYEKTVLVIGASGSVGVQITEYFLLKGCNVISHYFRNPKRLEALKANYPRSLVPIQGDLSKLKGCKIFLDKLVKLNPTIMAIFFCVGPYLVRPLHQTTDQEWSKLFNMNLRVVQRLAIDLQDLVISGFDTPWFFFGYEGIDNPANDYCPAYKIVKKALLDYMLSLKHSINPNIHPVMLNLGHMPESKDAKRFLSKGAKLTGYDALFKKIDNICMEPNEYQYLKITI